MSHLFNENMTYAQARMAFFQAVRGRTKVEIEIIKQEYRSIIPIITKREIEKITDGWRVILQSKRSPSIASNAANSQLDAEPNFFSTARTNDLFFRVRLLSP